MQLTSELLSTVVDAVYDKKGEKLTLIDLSEIESSPAPELVICQGRSTSQVAAIADNIRDEVSAKLHIKPYATDGYRNSQWIVVDFGSVMVHVFQPETREFYKLEDLWCDGKVTHLPDLD